jgi:hypothetical protein
MQVTIATSIRLIFILTLVVISVVAPKNLRGLPSLGEVADSKKPLTNLFTQKCADAKQGSRSRNLSAFKSLPEISGGITK